MSEQVNKTSASEAEIPKPAPVSYKFLDGLRGIGAFVVYIWHFLDTFYPMPSYEKENIPMLPDVFRKNPLITIWCNGSFWVAVFFILSGFVLSLRFFKIRKHTCISGGSFRRYARLMIPVWVILTFYYLAYRIGWLQDVGIPEGLTYLDFTYDATFGVWQGVTYWNGVVWTLRIELQATFFVYILALTVVEYQKRVLIYIAAILFYWLPKGMDLTSRNLDGNLNVDATYYPFFIIGMMLADLESMPSKPLDSIRSWNKPKTAIRDTILLFLAISFGGSFDLFLNYGPNSCTFKDSGQCGFWRVITLNQRIGGDPCRLIGSLSWMLLALFSIPFQWVLSSRPF